MKLTILLISSITLVSALSPPGPGPPCPADIPNVTNKACTNKCETSCDNLEEQVDPAVIFNLFHPSCKVGCFCIKGYIRDNDGDCVLQRRDTCDYDPCEGVPHTLWRRCVNDNGPKCYQESCKRNFSKIQGQCECKPGYALNLKHECIKDTSSECKKLAKTRACISE